MGLRAMHQEYYVHTRKREQQLEQHARCHPRSRGRLHQGIRFPNPDHLAAILIAPQLAVAVVHVILPVALVSVALVPELHCSHTVLHICSPSALVEIPVCKCEVPSPFSAAQFPLSGVDVAITILVHPDPFALAVPPLPSVPAVMGRGVDPMAAWCVVPPLSDILAVPIPLWCSTPK